MEYRNAKTNADGSFTCELNLPDIGWVPYTAKADDVEGLGREVHAAITAAGDASPYVPPTAEELRAAASMDMADFIVAIAQAGIITAQEARDWLSGNTLPASIESWLATLSGNAKIESYVQLYRRAFIARNSLVVGAIQRSGPYTDEQVDAVFGI